MIEPERHAYGRGRERFGELWPPASPDPEPWPVVVLLHGGFWRAGRTLESMRPLAIDLAGRDLAVWNLEFRRVGQYGGGWPAISSTSLRRTASVKLVLPSAVTTKLAGPPMMRSANAFSTS